MAAKRRCIDCPKLIPAGSRRCPTCARAHDQARGTPAQRGYGTAHRQLRARYAARIAQGETFTCAKCGQPVNHGMTWHLGHTDDRTGYTGPEHELCNLADAGQRAGRRDH